MSKTPSPVSVELIQNKIFIIRGKKVMFDKDLAELYGVETFRLNEQVRRNIKRFPPDFMFQLTKAEFENLISQFAISSWGGTRKLPMVFTHEGISMLSGVLHSPRAIQVNIQIMRTFTGLFEMMSTHKELAKKIEELERTFTNKFADHDKKFSLIFRAIKELISDKEEAKKKKGPMGFVVLGALRNPLKNIQRVFI
jgi:hypothetical protein